MPGDVGGGGPDAPQRRPQRYFSLDDGSCNRLRPQEGNKMWSYNYLSGQTSFVLPLRFLTVKDEYEPGDPGS